MFSNRIRFHSTKSCLSHTVIKNSKKKKRFKSHHITLTNIKNEDFQKCINVLYKSFRNMETNKKN